MKKPNMSVSPNNSQAGYTGGCQHDSKQTGGVTTKGKETQVLIQINEKQLKFTALTLR